MKRKIKVWGKMQLFEASAVGLPAYPDAHASVEPFSLVKTLSNADFRRNAEFVGEGEAIEPTKVDGLNLEEKETTMVNEEPAETTEKETKTDVEKSVEVEKKVEEAKPEVASDIAKAIADGIKAGLKDFELTRGVVEKNTVPEKKKSLGEIAMGMHNSAYHLSQD